MPAATLIGHLAGRRTAFVVMGVMTVGVFLALVVLVPPLPAVQVTRLKVPGAVPVCSQTWFSTSAPHSPEAASILFTSSFQATIAIEALLGGVVVDAVSPSTVMVLGGAIATLMVLTITAGRAVPKRHHHVQV